MTAVQVIQSPMRKEGYSNPWYQLSIGLTPYAQWKRHFRLYEAKAVGAFAKPVTTDVRLDEWAVRLSPLYNIRRPFLVPIRSQVSAGGRDK